MNAKLKKGLSIVVAVTVAITVALLLLQNRTEAFQEKVVSEKINGAYQQFLEYETILNEYEKQGILVDADFVNLDNKVEKFNNLLAEKSIDSAQDVFKEIKETFDGIAVVKIDEFFAIKVERANTLLSQNLDYYTPQEIVEIKNIQGKIEEIITNGKGSLTLNNELTDLSDSLSSHYELAEERYRLENNRINELENDIQSLNNENARLNRIISDLRIKLESKE